jgi:hypothetical protein
MQSTPQLHNEQHLTLRLAVTCWAAFGEKYFGSTTPGSAQAGANWYPTYRQAKYKLFSGPLVPRRALSRSRVESWRGAPPVVRAAPSRSQVVSHSQRTISALLCVNIPHAQGSSIEALLWATRSTSDSVSIARGELEGNSSCGGCHVLGMTKSAFPAAYTSPSGLFFTSARTQHFRPSTLSSSARQYHVTLHHLSV